MAEKSMFQQRKINGGKHKQCEEDIDEQADNEEDADVESDTEDNLEGSTDLASADTLNVGYEWGKRVDPALRRWIATKTCRRDISNEYFDNPPADKRESFY